MIKGAKAYLKTCATSVQSPAMVHISSSAPRSSHSRTTTQNLRTNAQSSNGSSSNLQVSYTQTSSSLPAAPPVFPYVFLLVSAGSTYRLAQMTVKDRSTFDFFHDLRLQYNSLRPFFRRRFSIWVYSHCDFYRVRQILLSQSCSCFKKPV